MHDGSHNNEMTEIALALAMAFFSIMVLTMVSMGAGQSSPFSSQHNGPVSAADQITIAPSDHAESRADVETRPAPRETVIIHYQGRFLTAELRPANPTSFTDANAGPVVIAIEPTLTLDEALAVRAQVPAANATVTTLDDRWLTSLKETVQ